MVRGAIFVEGNSSGYSVNETASFEIINIKHIIVLMLLSYLKILLLMNNNTLYVCLTNIIKNVILLTFFLTLPL